MFSSFVKLSRYLQLIYQFFCVKKFNIDNILILKDIDCGSLPLRQYFLEEFNWFFNFVFSCRLKWFEFLYNDPIWLAFHEKVDEPMF